MESRLVVVCHVWPGLTPFTVWDLPLRQWLLFASSADAWTAARQKQQTDEGT